MAEPLLLKHSVGLETIGNQHTPIFVRGLHLPVTWTKAISTRYDNQREIEIHILQGDSLDANACRLLAAVKVSGFSPEQKAQELMAKVTFQIDAAGHFHCHAIELPDRPLLVQGNSEPVDTQLESDFTGYGGQWGTQSSLNPL